MFLLNDESLGARGSRGGGWEGVGWVLKRPFPSSGSSWGQLGSGAAGVSRTGARILRIHGIQRIQRRIH